MQIDPKSLKPVTEQDLITQGVEDHIAAVRCQHLNEKRLKKIDMIESTIRSGLLQQMIQAMNAVQNQSPKASKQFAS